MNPVLSPVLETDTASVYPLLAATAIRAAAARRPSHIALRERDRAGKVVRELSYGALAERIDRIGQAASASLGLTRGDTVAVLAPNCSAFIEVVCGVSAMGAAVATLSPRLQAGEVRAILEDCAARVAFVHPTCVHLIERDAPAGLRIITLDGAYEAVLAAAPAQPLPSASLARETDGFVIPYTSGTTGKPKGVAISHRSRNICCYAMAVEYGCVGPDDHFLALAPLAHGAGFVMALAGLFFGATCDLVEGFDAEATLRMLHAGEHSGVFFVPTHFHAMFALGDEVLARYAGHCLKTIISNAAPLPQETKQRIVNYFGEGLLHECYGSTEGGIVTNLRPRDQLRKQRCVGLPFPGTLVRLVGDEGRDVGPGEVGELLSRSPSNFSGYWHAPQETTAALRDGWVSAGDLAICDDEGYFYIVDRKKDLIISGGLNVYPREVEEVLAAHPAVADVAVVGLADAYWGERVVAFLVAAEAAGDTDGLAMFCAERLADYKRPREFRWVDRLPRNSAGKLLKRELRG